MKFKSCLFLALPIILGACSTKSVSNFDGVGIEPASKEFNYEFGGSTDALAKEIARLVNLKTGLRKDLLSLRSTRVTPGKSNLRGQDYDVACVQGSCKIDLKFINGEKTNSAGRIVSEQVIKMSMNVERSGEFLKGTLFIPNEFHVVEKRNLIGIKQDLLLSPDQLEAVLKRLLAMQLPSNSTTDLVDNSDWAVHDSEGRRKKLVAESIDRFEKRKNAPLEVGMLVCSSDNRIGYVEVVADSRAKIDVKGKARGSDYQLFQSENVSKFRFSEVSTGLKWENVGNWVNCGDFISLN